MKLFTKATSLIIVFAIAGTVRADLTLSFSDADVLAGDQVAVTARIANDMFDQELSGYNFTIDVGNDGNALPPGISLNIGASASLATNLVNFSLADGLPPVFNFDIIASDSSGGPGSETVSATPTDLFTLVFDVDSSVAVGTQFDIGFVEPTIAAQFSLTLDGVSSNFDAVGVVETGTITVLGVPEPASTSILGVVGLLICRRSR